MSQDENMNYEADQPEIPRDKVEFNALGQPILEGSEKFCTFVGRAGKTHCPPAYVSWRVVPEEIKDQVWKAVNVKYNVPSLYKKQTLVIARTAWRQWKYELRRHYDMFGTDGERKKNIPKRTKKEECESFVDMCSTIEDRTRLEKGKFSRQHMRRPHTTGRRGFARLAEDLKKEDGTTDISRTRLFVAGHTSRNKEKPAGPEIEQIQRMIENEPDSVYNDLDHDPVAMVCGRDRRGRVLGLGSGISKTAFHASAPAREIANQERRASEGMRGELQTLKISVVQQANEHKILEDRVATLMEKHDSRQESSGGSYCEGRGSNDSHLPSTCLVKNLRRKVVAIGRVNRDIAPSEEAYKIVLDNVYESQECLYDQEGTFGDVRLGDQITWPKGFVEFIGV